MSESVENSARTLYCTFWLQSHRFGIDAQRVKEVTRMSHCTPIPHAPADVLGYVNLRGQIYLAIDVRQTLGIKFAAPTSDSRLIILRRDVADCLAVVADRIGPIVSVNLADREELVTATPDKQLDSEANRLTSGVARLDEGLLTILDACRFLPSLQDANPVPRTTQPW